MTYALAWKTDKEVFLAADTAITTTGESVDSLDMPVSSLGRSHVLQAEQGRKVEERLVKIYSHNGVGITFAGNCKSAIEIIKEVFEKIDDEAKPKEALESALFKIRIPKSQVVQLAIGYYDNGPKIINFDSREGNLIHEDQELVQMGNPPAEFQRRTKNWIVDILKYKPTADARLALMLGILQSYDLLNDIIQIGIGGVFTGLYINKDGLTWQPDLLFIEYGGDHEIQVGTCFRHNCLAVNSPTIKQSRCFTSTFLPFDSSLLHGMIERAIQKAKRLRSNLEYEYVVILSHENNSLTIIEMKRYKRHLLLWLESHENQKGTSVSTSIFPKLKNILNADTDRGLTYISYQAPIIKTIPTEKKTIREINNN